MGTELHRAEREGGSDSASSVRRDVTGKTLGKGGRPSACRRWGACNSVRSRSAGAGSVRKSIGQEFGRCMVERERVEWGRSESGKGGLRAGREWPGRGHGSAGRAELKGGDFTGLEDTLTGTSGGRREVPMD